MTGQKSALSISAIEKSLSSVFEPPGPNMQSPRGEERKGTALQNERSSSLRKGLHDMLRKNAEVDPKRTKLTRSLSSSKNPTIESDSKQKHTDEAPHPRAKTSTK